MPPAAPGWGWDSGGAGGGWSGGHGGSAGREVWGRGVEGPQGLYVVQLARVSPPSEETKVAGAEQVVEGGRWEGDECPNASRARSGLLAPQLDGFGGRTHSDLLQTRRLGVAHRTSHSQVIRCRLMFHALCKGQSGSGWGSIPRCRSRSWLVAVPCHCLTMSSAAQLCPATGLTLSAARQEPR